MDKELKEKWVAALRSGEYQQGNKFLCKIVDGYPKHCCLGVLAEVSGAEKQYSYGVVVFNESEGLNTKHWETAAFGLSVGLSQTYQQTLWRMNDNDGMSFNEIADWIEANDI